MSPNSGNGGNATGNRRDTTPTPTHTPQQESRKSNNGNMSGNRSNRGITNVQSTDGATFEGGCPEINVVVGIRTDKISKKVTFSVFTENVADYIITTFKHEADIELSIHLLTNPFDGFAEA